MNIAILLAGLFIQFQSIQCSRLAKYCDPDPTQLIFDVYHKYNTSGVIFVTAQKMPSFEWSTFVHEIGRDLSRQAIPSVGIVISRLNALINLYRSRVTRPLVVYVSPKLSILSMEMNEIDMTYPVWLAMSISKSNTVECDFCKTPDGNRLPLRFNVMMYVWCYCMANQLHEWWSLNGTDIQYTTVSDWSLEEGLVSQKYDNTIRKRRTLNGMPFRVAYFKDSALISVNNGVISGFYGEVLLELSSAMNFTISPLIEADCYGIFYPKNRTWSGILGIMSRNEADLGVVELSNIPLRREYVEFTVPILTSPCRLYFRKTGGAKIQWSSYFEVLQSDVWITIVVLIALTSPMLTFINLKTIKRSLLNRISDHFLNIFGVFCQQGLSEFPSGTPLKIAYFSLILCGSLVSAFYSAALISFLTITHDDLPFDTISEFSEASSWKLITIRDSADYNLFQDSKDPVIKNMMKMMKPTAELPVDIYEGFIQVCTDDVAFYINEVVKHLADLNLSCQIASIATKTTDSLTMILAHDSSYTGLIDYYIKRFHDHGIINRLELKYFSDSDASAEPYDEVSIHEVLPIMLLLFCGNIVAIIFFICEKLHFPLSINSIRLNTKCVRTNAKHRKKKLKKLIQKKYNSRQLPELTIKHYYWK